MIKFRLYSRYDDTDVIKSSQDSSILNKEEKGKTSDSTKVGLAAVAGGLIGASGKSTKLGKLGGGAKGAAIGALAGMGVNALNKANKERKDNNFYNARLREAKRAATRREKLDWSDRIHNRQGYE
jgi:uncharacterized membrane protein YebE (DUF533 family)